MCTSIVVNKNKTIVGWNMDLLDMEYRVSPADEGVFIAVNDATEGWIENVIMLDIDLLLQKKTLQEIRDIAAERPVYSIPGLTFMSALSDADGNVLHIVPGQGCSYYEKPEYKILTNFSPYKQNSETHPWMGWDRYHIAKDMLKNASDDFDVEDCFEILKAVSQEVCPTVVSMVYDVTDRTVYWCENREWDKKARKRKCFGESLIE